MRLDPSGDLAYQLDKIINGGIEFEEHIRGTFVEQILVLGENRIEHNLGYTPVGFNIILQEGQGDVWATRVSEWNSQSLWLESSVESLRVRLFVL